ncbi:porin family protein [Moritella sp. 24]|nr:porin family protein [Moritella sp. 24]
MTTDNTEAKQPSASVSATSDQKVKGLYFGVGAGATEFEHLDYNGPTVDSDDNMIKFIAGYQFSRIFALEGQYTKYGEINGYGWEPTAVSLTANLGYTFSNGLRPFGVAGFSAIDLNKQYDSGLEDKGVGLRYGFGLEYAPAVLSGFSARVGYEIDIFGIEYTYSSDSSGYSYGYTEIEEFALGSFYASVAYKF